MRFDSSPLSYLNLVWTKDVEWGQAPCFLAYSPHLDQGSVTMEEDTAVWGATEWGRWRSRFPLLKRRNSDVKEGS